jgi:hypothetical protein
MEEFMGIRSTASIHIIKSRNPTVDTAVLGSGMVSFSGLTAKQRNSYRELARRYVLQTQLLDRGSDSWNQFFPTLRTWAAKFGLETTESANGGPLYSSPAYGIGFNPNEVSIPKAHLGEIVEDMRKRGLFSGWELRHSLSIGFFRADSVEQIFFVGNNLAGGPEIVINYSMRETAALNSDACVEFRNLLQGWTQILQREFYVELERNFEEISDDRWLGTWLRINGVHGFDRADGNPAKTTAIGRGFVDTLREIQR